MSYIHTFTCGDLSVVIETDSPEVPVVTDAVGGVWVHEGTDHADEEES